MMCNNSQKIIKKKVEWNTYRNEIKYNEKKNKKIKQNKIMMK